MSYYRGSRRSSNFGRNSSPRKFQNNRNKRAGEYIDPSRFIKTATPVKVEDYSSKHVFNDFGLNKVINSNLANKGYVIPSPIQDQAIPVAMSGNDVIGVASTGTGKTAAFALPILNKLMSDRSSAALIIAPTRELALQIEEECRALGRNSGLFGAILIGGVGMGNQLRDLRRNPRIVIGTPGRIKDHIERKTLNLSKFNVVVLDEVDRMLDMGFINDVTFILESTSPVRQSLFFSATIDDNVQKLIERFTDNPVAISIQASATSDNVHQNVVRYKAKQDKLDALHDVLINGEVSKVIIFDETQRSVERLNQELINRGFLADAIHGGKSQGQRQRALKRFKDTEVNILVATDVAARGIDVADISHVINFTVPKAYEDYIHRIGRAGRAGKVGYALTFIESRN